MVTCSLCQKPIDKVPEWLNSVKVNFVCNNCPNRSVKSITQVTLETAQEPSQGKDHTVEGAMDEAEEDLED